MHTGKCSVQKPKAAVEQGLVQHHGASVCCALLFFSTRGVAGEDGALPPCTGSPVWHFGLDEQARLAAHAAAAASSPHAGGRGMSQGGMSAICLAARGCGMGMVGPNKGEQHRILYPFFICSVPPRALFHFLPRTQALQHRYRRRKAVGCVEPAATSITSRHFPSCWLLGDSATRLC